MNTHDLHAGLQHYRAHWPDESATVDAFESLLAEHAAGRGAGLAPGLDPESGWEAIAELWNNTAAGTTRREALAEAMKVLDKEFHAHGTECGFNYASGVLITEPGAGTAGDAIGSLVYTPSSSPGHHLPHAWVQSTAGEVSTIELTAAGRWALIVDEGADAWRAALDGASGGLAAFVDVFEVGSGREFDDRRGEWAARREVAPDGALLVRPDGIVAWRAATAADAGTFRDALNALAVASS